MITFSNISLQSHGILARSRANSALGALTLLNNELTRIDTPNGYFGAGRMHYYVKDYQGNVRQVTDADGNVEQDNHYYPYGMLMAESSDILADYEILVNGVNIDPTNGPEHLKDPQKMIGEDNRNYIGSLDNIDVISKDLSKRKIILIDIPEIIPPSNL